MIHNTDAFSLTYRGRVIKAAVQDDIYADAPWENETLPGNFVTDWTSRPKLPNEYCVAGDPITQMRTFCKRTHIFFDLAGYVKSLRREGLTGREADVQAVWAAKRFRGWWDDKWRYLTATVTIDGMDEFCSSVGGIESDGCEHILEELIQEAKCHIDKYQRDNAFAVRLLLHWGK